MKYLTFLVLITSVFCFDALAEVPPAGEAPQLTAVNGGTTVETFRGSGNQTTNQFRLNAGSATFKIRLNWEKPDPDLSGQEGNFSVQLMDGNQKPVEYIIGTIDFFDGARTVEIPQAGTYTLKVVAPGSWTIAIVQ